MLLDLLLIATGFILLIVGANKLVQAASSIARRAHIPEIVIGLTIVALGTSSPELVVNMVASARQDSAMVLGNVLGSNLFNVLMILGITATVKPLTVTRNTTWFEIPLSLLAALLVWIMANDSILNKTSVNIISTSEGIVLISFFLVFLVYNIELANKAQDKKYVDPKNENIIASIGWLIAGFAGLIFGGHFIVDNAVDLAHPFGISERVIAITVVSVGTSLPELATSLAAVRSGKVDLAIGNVVGSNIFNIFLILGASAIVNPLPINTEVSIDIELNILSGLLLFIFLFLEKKRQLRRPSGILFLLIYTVYIFYLLFPG
ncbi:calcium/sodium antiporter [soil metagenome]